MSSEDLREKGFVRVRVDGEIHELEETFNLKKTFKHTIEVIVDRLIIRKDLDFNRRLSDSLETASQFGEGVINVLYENKQGDKYEKMYSEDFACPDCGISFDELSPRMFSFNKSTWSMSRM